MATWIAHLRIAERLLKRIEGLDPQSFYIGSIAPDSGVPDEKWERFDPPPEISHYKTGVPGTPYRIHDLDFFRDYLAIDRDLVTNVPRASFLMAYFLHLVTDNLWIQRIYQPTRRLFRADFDSESAFIHEMKRDWYGLDFGYLRAHPQALFWQVFRDCRYEANHVDLVPMVAVQERIAYIVEYYQRQDPKIEAMMARRRSYLTAPQMECFVDGAVERTFGIYRSLWEESRAIGDLCSALELSWDLDD